jgi:hypothetical protein
MRVRVMLRDTFTGRQALLFESTYGLLCCPAPIGVEVSLEDFLPAGSVHVSTGFRWDLVSRAWDQPSRLAAEVGLFVHPVGGPEGVAPRDRLWRAEDDAFCYLAFKQDERQGVNEETLQRFFMGLLSY